MGNDWESSRHAECFGGTGGFLEICALTMPGKGKTTNSPNATRVPPGPFGNQPKTAYGRPTTDDKKFLTEAEVVERYRGVISPGTLRNWRHQKIGPPFQKCGRGVLYPTAGSMGSREHRHLPSRESFQDYRRSLRPIEGVRE